MKRLEASLFALSAGFVAYFGAATIGTGAMHTARAAGPVVAVKCSGGLSELNGNYFNDIGFGDDNTTGLPAISSNGVSDRVGFDSDNMFLGWIKNPISRGAVPGGGMAGDTCKVG